MQGEDINLAWKLEKSDEVIITKMNEDEGIAIRRNYDINDEMCNKKINKKHVRGWKEGQEKRWKDGR